MLANEWEAGGGAASRVGDAREKRRKGLSSRGRLEDSEVDEIDEIGLLYERRVVLE